MAFTSSLLPAPQPTPAPELSVVLGSLRDSTFQLNFSWQEKESPSRGAQEASAGRGCAWGAGLQRPLLLTPQAAGASFHLGNGCKGVGGGGRLTRVSELLSRRGEQVRTSRQIFSFFKRWTLISMISVKSHDCSLFTIYSEEK